MVYSLTPRYGALQKLVLVDAVPEIEVTDPFSSVLKGSRNVRGRL
jgi:hypothetical protein